MVDFILISPSSRQKTNVKATKVVSLDETGLNESVPIAVERFSSFKIFNS